MVLRYLAEVVLRYLAEVVLRYLAGMGLWSGIVWIDRVFLIQSWCACVGGWRGYVRPGPSGHRRGWTEVENTQGHLVAGRGWGWWRGSIGEVDTAGGEQGGNFHSSERREKASRGASLRAAVSRRPAVRPELPPVLRGTPPAPGPPRWATGGGKGCSFTPLLSGDLTRKLQ